ncbi:MAG: hypothetical protein HC920_21035 [Oscillatoriales cyanobacterium SM2_3_0]|nr:hypothetical protein [Oscillatoriales cyanobacterium SM2_3_0]
MNGQRLHRLISSSDRTQHIWLSLSLVFAVIYGLLSLKQAFAQANLVQDDARQHIFWMLRFIDPGLFPGDLIADYFQSVAPAGYTAVYQLGAWWGVNPLVFCRILPPILAIISTGYFFYFCLEILPIPLTGFIGSLILNQVIWLKDDVASGTPRAFIYPIFIAFLYYLLRNSRVGVGIAVLLMGLFYPQYVFVACGILILRLFVWKSGLLQLTSQRTDLQISGLGLVGGILVLLPYALHTSEFGPTINRAQAMQSLEFFPNGRSMFFHADPFDFWLTGRRSGMFPKSLLTPVTQSAGLLLPILLIFRNAFPLSHQINSKIWVLFQLLISAVFMFFMAHAWLFKLHLPSRYTGLSFRIIMATATAIALTLIIDGLFKWIESQKNSVQNLKRFNTFLAGGLISGILISLLFYPSFVPFFPLVKYRVGEMTGLYSFFQQQPKDIMIASLSGEVNQLPTFARRSILVGREYTIPYHLGYYRQLNQRTLDLLRAHYTPDLTGLKNFIQTYGIDFFLIEQSAFTPDFFEHNDWILEFPPGQTAFKQIQTGKFPALSTRMNQCLALHYRHFFVVDGACILNLKD